MNLCHRFLSITCSILLTTIILSAQTPPKREFRGAWIATVTNLDWPSSPSASPTTQRSELVAILEVLAAAGVNAVIFQVRPECDALYNSPYEPWSYWLTGKQGTPPSDGYDPLEFAVQEAHLRGMEIHAWFNPYRAERAIGNYALAPNHVSLQHPEWTLKIGTYRLLNPGLRSVRDFVSKIVADVVRRYDVDGAHMDDYFYQEGITTEDSAAYRTDPRGFANVGDWRRDNVNLLIRQINDSVKAIKPNVKWGISPRGIWKNGVPAGIVGSDNYSAIYCDAVAWLSGQYIDYLAPQLYWKIGGPQDYTKLVPWWALQANGRHIYTGNATYRIGDAAFGFASELANQFFLNRVTAGVQGNIQFRANNIRDNIGGFTDMLKSTLFRSPAIIPSMSWKELVPPNAPANVRVISDPDNNRSQIVWDPPTRAIDGDTASRYLVYRFVRPTYSPSDLDYSNNLISLAGTTTVIPSGRVDTTGVKYYYAVSSIDRNNNESQLSNLVTITTSTPLTVPILAYPVNAEQNFPRGGSIRWFKPRSALAYYAQVALTPEFAPTSLVSAGSTVDSSFAPQGLVPQQTYYWRVVAGNQEEAGSYSQAFSFKTGWPLPPTLVYPVLANGITRTPTFVWNKGAGASFHIRVTDNGTLVNVVDVVVNDTTFLCNKILDANKIYTWAVSSINAYGASDWSAEGRFRTSNDITVVDGESTVPSEFSLSQNYPNPFNPATKIRFAVPLSGLVSLRVYDVLGREVAVLVDNELRPGFYTAQFDARTLSSGVYFYRLVGSGFVESKKMQLVK